MLGYQFYGFLFGLCGGIYYYVGLVNGDIVQGESGRWGRRYIQKLSLSFEILYISPSLKYAIPLAPSCQLNAATPRKSKSGVAFLTDLVISLIK
jgi:hypothetical protein